MKIFLAISFIFLAGCVAQPKTVYLPVPIALPAKPEIPKVPGKELSCLSDSAKEKLLNRDKVIKDYILLLEETIKSTDK